MQPILPSESVPVSAVTPSLPNRRDPVAIRSAAEAFEATFLAEMLSHTGLGEVRGSLNGGAGEKAFSSFLTREYADRIAETRSIGLANHIERALIDRADARGAL